MENIDIVGILNQGLPGLVFLLSLLAFWLLTKEQQKNSPSQSILSSIRHFMYINIFLALLTVGGLVIEHKYLSVNSNDLDVFNIEAKLDGSHLQMGFAAVCINADYANRHLLLRDVNTGKAIQVFAEKVVPCSNGMQISLHKNDAFNLGWEDDIHSSMVEVVPAMPGTMFII